MNGWGVYAIVSLIFAAMLWALIRGSKREGAAGAETKAAERQVDALRSDVGEANEIESRADLARRNAGPDLDVLRRAGRIRKPED